MLINRTLFASQMLSLLSGTNPAYIEISLKEIYEVYNFSKSVMGLHDKASKISQRKLKMGKK